MNRSEVRGKTLTFTPATEADAPFIVELRQAKGRFLSATSGEIQAQVEWLKRYEERDEAYFIIRTHEPIGTVRLYDPRGDSFCWGSWILKDGAPSTAGIESALMVYKIGLDMGFTRSHFEVDVGNEKVRAFHERFGARPVSETDYEISHEAILKSLAKYGRYLE